MSNKAMQATAAYLEENEFHFSVNEEHSLIETGIGGLDNCEDIKIYIIFDEDENSMGLRSVDFCKFPAEKKALMYEVCSKINDQYRWVKFHVDESDNTISLATDAIISLDTCGAITYELLFRMAGIADEAYPHFMKALWA